jgi:hypothetical protein
MGLVSTLYNKNWKISEFDVISFFQVVVATTLKHIAREYAETGAQWCQQGFPKDHPSP